MRPRISSALLALASAAGLFFTSWSTVDFVQHLDRQVHSIHCSFVPGMTAADASGASGCHVALMSPWSSVFRTELWGGLPVALPGMAVFAFLLYRALERIVNRREDDVHANDFLVVAWLVPVLTSIVFGYVAMVELDAFCKVCAGIYGASFIGFGAAIAARMQKAAPVEDEADAAGPAPTGTPWGHHVGATAEGVLFVALPVALYAWFAPDFSSFLGTCGELVKPEDPYGIMIPVGEKGGVTAVEVLDPLCPACAGFERRLEASGLGASMSRNVVLFPLDSTCNWMVDSPLHPGACVVSEAVLCAGEQADAVLQWAFEHGTEIREATAADPGAAARMVSQAFPAVASCLGTPDTKQRLNRSMRWIVGNQLPILTPQFYVNGVKLCDDDTDLGMDWALSRLVRQAQTGSAE